MRVTDKQISDACDRIIKQLEDKYPELKCDMDNTPILARRKAWETACGAIVMYIIHYGVPEKYHGDIVELIKDMFIPYIFFKPKGSDRYIVSIYDRKTKKVIQNYEWLYFQTICLMVFLFKMSNNAFRNSSMKLAEEIYDKYKHAKQ